MQTAKPAAKPEVKAPAPAAKPAAKPEAKAPAPAAKPAAKTPARPAAPAPASVFTGAMEAPADNLDTGAINRNDEIIALHKSGKSIMEISKLLGMGQGEVKLIIDLYC